jgi:hypothetical protein
MTCLRGSRLLNRVSWGAVLLATVSAGTGCVTIADPKHARPNQVIGIVDEPRSGLLRILTTARTTVEVTIDRSTTYMKWLTHQPWTIDQAVSPRSLTTGRCVKVTSPDVHRRVATRIEVSLDPAGGVNDPCLAIR